MREYTVREYEKEDYEQQEYMVENMSRKQLADSIEEIAASYIGSYNFTGSEGDFENHKMQMIMHKVAEILESDPPENNPLEEVLEIQEGYQMLEINKKLTGKTVHNLVTPFRNRYRLTEWQALQIARNELSVSEIVALLK